MPTCAKCNNWVYSHEKTCSKCGHAFEMTSTLRPVMQEPISRDATGPTGENTRNIEGVVYLLKAGNHYKIGKTISFERRYKEIKLQLPFKAEEVHRIRTNNINRLESHWHRHFHKKRKNGEWFELHEVDLVEFTSVQEVIYM